MAKARGKVTRSRIPKKGYIHMVEPTLEIAVWCPDDKAEEPPEQVHFIMHLPGVENMPLILRFKSPDTLGFMIEEMIRYRREVWPEAELIEGEKLVDWYGDGSAGGVD